MTNNIDIVIKRILKREGKFVIDHAGPTNFGITIPAYSEFLGRRATEEDIRNMKNEQAIVFYNWLLKKERVAEINNFDTMDLLFDCMVNHGNKTAIKWAQGFLKLKDDGLLGRMTIDAINKNPKGTYYAILCERTKLYAHLSVSNPKKYQRYLKGWINRSCDFIKEI